MAEAATTAPRGFSVPEAADRLSISRTTAYRLIGEGTLRVVKIGHRTVVPASEIERLLRIEDADPVPAA